MIHYDPAHHSFVGFAVEEDEIEEPTNGTAPTLPSPPALLDMQACGFTNHPEGKRGLNNSYGYTIGQRGGAYRKRGAQAPTLSLALRGGGAIDLLQKINRATNGSKALTPLCFIVGVPPLGDNPGWTDIYRFAKINSLALALKETSGEAAEIEATLQVEAMCRYTPDAALAPVVSDWLDDLKSPLYWHDVRSFQIGQASASGTTDLRQALTGFNVQIGHNLERKGERANWGDNNPLSRTCYHLLEHTVTVSGDIQLHSRLPKEYFSAAVNSQSWGDITLSISNTDTVTAGKDSSINLTLQKCMPTDETTGGVEPKAQIGHSVPFVAADYALTVA